jgi:tRNA (cmo5U34)-methyltransferase
MMNPGLRRDGYTRSLMTSSPNGSGPRPKPDLSAQAARDAIFKAPRKRIDDFAFGKETAAVFDDMLDRSVPFYGEFQRMVAELSADFAQEGTAIYDLGCSTCTSLLHIAKALPKDRHVRFVGIDYSPEMLERGRRKLEESGFPHPFELRLGDLNDGVAIQNASVALLVLTLQFVRPLYRDALLASVARGLATQGCAIIVEKVLGESSTINRLFIEHYYDLKRRNGYSDMEISQKREALENVLVPYRLKENRELLLRAGFSQVDVFFKWYNFCGIIAVK